MDEDISNVFQKLNSILENPEMSNNLKNILNNFSSSNNQNTTCQKVESQSEENTYNNQNFNSEDHPDERAKKESNSENSTKNPFSDIDINTILKIKQILDSVNSSENDTRSNLLLSLKPYLADNKKEKLNQYIKFLRLAKAIEILNPTGGDFLKNE